MTDIFEDDIEWSEHSDDIEWSEHSDDIEWSEHSTDYLMQRIFDMITDYVRDSSVRSDMFDILAELEHRSTH